jgi:hypothetical protein
VRPVEQSEAAQHEIEVGTDRNTQAPLAAQLVGGR